MLLTKKLKMLVGYMILYVPVNDFSVKLGRSHRFLGITSTFCVRIVKVLCWGILSPQNEIFDLGTEDKPSTSNSIIVKTSDIIHITRQLRELTYACSLISSTGR